MAGPEKSDALVLKTQKWSESSKIAHVYTRRWGRISVLAKGAMRPRAKFWDHLETFSLIEALVYRKPREQLQLLAQSQLKDPFAGLYGDSVRAGYGFAAMEFLERHTLEEGNERLFDWTVFNLRRWQTKVSPGLDLAFYEYLLVALGDLGFQPIMEACRSCSRVPAPGQKVLFDQAGGGIICRQCAKEGEAYQVLTPEAYERVKKTVSGSIDWENEPLPLPAVIEEFIQVTEGFYGYHLGGGRLKALEFVRRVAEPATRRGEDV